MIHEEEVPHEKLAKLHQPTDRLLMQHDSHLYFLTVLLQIDNAPDRFVKGALTLNHVVVPDGIIRVNGNADNQIGMVYRGVCPNKVTVAECSPIGKEIDGGLGQGSQCVM